jgi:hypothetical protein
VKLETILAMARHGISFDTETYLGIPGCKIPPLVCGSAGWLGDDGLPAGEFLDKEQTMHLFAQLLEDPSKIIVGANITYDLSVMALHAARLGVDIMPQIYRALLDEERIYDLQLAEALHAIAEGHLGMDPFTGSQIKNADGRPGRYSLFACVKMVLGREDAKVNDEWRLRYGELDKIPLAQWPQSAIDYPIDDARNTIECALAQVGQLRKLAPSHRFSQLPGGVQGPCQDCGASVFGGPCSVMRRHRNLQDLANQVGTQFALHMAGSWGLHINQDSVDKIEREALRNQEGADKPFIELGILRDDGSQDLARTKKMVAVAYGAQAPCPQCKGTGKVQSPKAKVIRCRECRGACVAAKMTPAVLTWKAGHPKGCEACNNQGTYLDPTALIVCYGGMEDDPETAGKQKKIKTCDGTGLVLVNTVPRSDKEGVGYGRDALNDSGDDTLIALAAYQESRKDLEVYVPFFRRARMPVAGHGQECPHPANAKDACTCSGPYKSIPLTLWPNTLVETGRVSYDGIIQLIKRASGYINAQEEYVPSLRECFEARGPRYEVVEVPDDYVLQPGEQAVG